MKKISKILVITLLLAVLLPVIESAALADANVSVKRLYGNSRIDTAIAVSKEAYPGKTSTVILAGYNGQADALTGTLLADAKKAPLLLTAKAKLDNQVLGEIKRLGASQVYILGGQAVVSMEVENKLKSENLNVIRLKGNNRAETAIAIAREVFSTTLPKEAFVIESNALVDALSIGSIAAQKKAPIFIMGKDKVLPATAQALKSFKIDNITIIGGESTVTSRGKSELEKLVKNVARVAGKDRIETSLAVANKYNPNLTDTIIANGYTLPDALVGGYVAAKNNSSILLVQKNKVSEGVKEKILKAKNRVYILGGTSVISDDVYKSIVNMFKSDIVFEEVVFPKVTDTTKPPKGTYVANADQLCFVTKDIVIAAQNDRRYTDGGNVFRSTDGGVNWVQVLENVGNVNGIYFTDDKIGYIAGGYSLNAASQYVGKTRDGGKTWTSMKDVFIRDVNEVRPSDKASLPTVMHNVIAPNKTTVYMVGRHTIYGSFDGGASWNLVGGRRSRKLDDKSFLYSHTLGYVDGLSFIGTHGGGFEYKIDGSSDSMDWNRWEDTPWKDKELVNLEFKDRKTGWALTKNNTTKMLSIYRTDDTGVSWTFLSEAPVNDREIGFPATRSLKYYRGILFGSNGQKVTLSKDGGVTWTKNDWSGIYYELLYKEVDGELRAYKDDNGRYSFRNYGRYRK